MQDNQKWNLIIRCLTNEASEDEQEMLNNWLRESSDNRDFFEEVWNVWSEAGKLIPDYQIEDSYQKLHARIHNRTFNINNPTAIPRDKRTKKGGKVFLFLKVAAVWTLAIITGIVVFWVVAQKQWHENDLMFVENKAGKKSKIVLPDSSVVWLNSNSSLAYPSHFSSSRRDVTLKGEAFFEVKKNPQSPFVIETGMLNTAVLGTSFNIKTQNKEKEVLISVVTGQVMVTKTWKNKKTQQLGILYPNQQLVYNETQNNFQIINVNNSYDYSAWKDGILRLKDMHFDQIVQKLEDWYGVKIVVKNDELRNCQIEGTFKDVPVEKVIKMLSISAGFQYSIKGDSIILNGAGYTGN